MDTWKAFQRELNLSLNPSQSEPREWTPRHVRPIQVKGQTMSIREAYQLHADPSITYVAFWKRINQGWSIERALSPRQTRPTIRRKTK